MKIKGSRGMRYVVLVLLFLLGIGTLVNLYLQRSGSRDKDALAGSDSPGMNRLIVEVPFDSSLPKWFLTKIGTTTIMCFTSA